MREFTVHAQEADANQSLAICFTEYDFTHKPDNLIVFKDEHA